MSYWNAKYKNGYGEYEITFASKKYEKTKAVEKFCQAIIDKKITSENADAVMERLLKLNEPVMGWIPVTERLPEDGEIVLVCGSRSGVYTAVHNKPGCYRGWHKLNSKNHYCNPTHWMPLPEPPKEDAE